MEGTYPNLIQPSTFASASRKFKSFKRKTEPPLLPGELVKVWELIKKLAGGACARHVRVDQLLDKNNGLHSSQNVIKITQKNKIK